MGAVSAVPDVSIVIVSFRVCDLLAQCLKSLEEQGPGPRFEVWVVDNASRDGTVDQVRAQFPWVRLIANSENRGFAAANNQALEQASGRYLTLLNPDCRISAQQPAALDTLVQFMDSKPRAGACGPSLRYADGAFQHSAFMLPSLLQVYFDLFPPHPRLAESILNGRYPRRRYKAGIPFQVGHPLGAALFIRREAMEQVGFFDEDYFLYAEEVDWCLRAHRIGWEIWCVPNAQVIHLEAQSTRQFRDEMFIELWRARLHYYRKHYGRLYNLFIRAIVRHGMDRARANSLRTFVAGKATKQEWENRARALDQVKRMAELTG